MDEVGPTADIWLRTWGAGAIEVQGEGRSTAGGTTCNVAQEP
jgi:hypothetical protein